jgi:hypothetical protein
VQPCHCMCDMVSLDDVAGHVDVHGHLLLPPPSSCSIHRMYALSGCIVRVSGELPLTYLPFYSLFSSTFYSLLSDF